MPYRNTPPPAHPRCDQTPVWAQLQQHVIEHGKHCNVRQAIAQDSGRFARMAVQAPHISVDFSRNLLDATTETLLLQLAQECQIPQAIEAWQKAAPLSKDGETYLNLAKVLHSEDRIPEAKEAARQALAKGVKRADDAKKIINLK